MSKSYKNSRYRSGSHSPPKKGNTGATIVKWVAISMAVFAGISLLATLLPGRLSSDETPTEPQESAVSYSWDERSYYWPIDRTVADGYLTITQSQGSADTTANCQQFFVTATDGEASYLPDWTDFDVETNFKLTRGGRTDFSIMGRLQLTENGGFNYYEIVFRNDTGRVSLRKVTQQSWGSKTATVVASSDTSFAADVFHDVKVTFVGNDIMIYVDDFETPVLTYRDSDPIKSGTVGIDLARLGVVAVDFIKICDNDNVLFADEFENDSYFPAESSEVAE